LVDLLLVGGNLWSIKSKQNSNGSNGLKYNKKTNNSMCFVPKCFSFISIILFWQNNLNVTFWPISDFKQASKQKTIVGCFLEN
jgi:hypothetical protein